MNRERRGLRSWTGLRVASLLAACAGALSIVSDGSAAPPLRALDPKTGLPQTWDSHIGTGSPPSSGRRRVQAGPAPTPVVDPCHHYDKTACADPAFVTRCPNAAQACSSYQELDACNASPPPAGKTCADVFYANHQAQLNAVPQVRRVVPSRGSLATQSKPVNFVKFDRSKITVGGMDHAFSTRLAHPALRSTTRARSGERAPTLTYLQSALRKLPTLTTPAAASAPSGLIASCDEYGARKYLSLTQFDSDVSDNQRDPRATFNLIYSPKWASIVSQSDVKDSEGAVSTTAPTATLDVMGNIVVTPGAPLHFQPVQEPRNQFLQVATTFGHSYSTPSSTWVPVPSLGLPDFSQSPAIAAAVAAYQKSSEIFFNQVLFTQRPFTSRDSPTIKETFAWHQAKNGALWEPDTQDLPGKYVDEELRIRYDRLQSLQGLLARRYQIADFIRNVGSICRTPTEPPPIPPQDASSLSNLATKLTVYSSQMEQLVGTGRYLSEVDPWFETAGVSKGWTIYDPIAGTQTVIHGPQAQGASWQVKFDPIVDNGPYVFFGSSCRSQIGCTAVPVRVTQGEILQTVAKLMAAAAQATAYNNNLPKLRADAHQGFLESLNAANVECEGFGISPMFASSGIPADPNALNLVPPSLSPAEAQRVATAFTNNVLPKLAAVDALIGEQLNAGVELSCFQASQNGCDWSPNRLIDFVHTYRKEMDANREADVQRCERYTTHTGAGAFMYKSRLNDLMKSKGYNWNAARSSVKAFEKFLLDGESEMLKQLKDEVGAMVAMQTYDEDGKTPAIGQISSTDGGFGGDMFGANYGAGGGFRFGNLSTDNQGHFTKDDNVGRANNFTYWAGNYAVASVNILGSTSEVFNARMDIAVTDGHVLDLQKGATATDRKYMNGQVSGGRDYVSEKGGVQDTYNKESQAVQGADKNRIVQGHLHFRVVGDDLFTPVNTALKPRVYASTEPIYSFEPASYNRTLFDESTTITVVFIPVTIRGWATFEAGINYSIAASLDRPNIDSLSQQTATPTNRTPFQLNNTIEPYAEVDGNVSIAIGVPGLEVGLKGSLELIRLGLPYHSSASVQFFDGGATVANKSAGNRFSASQGLDFTLSTLSGTVSAFVQFLFWEAEQEIFGWDGLTSTTPIFSINEVDASVAMSSQAVRDLVKSGFTLGQ